MKMAADACLFLQAVCRGKDSKFRELCREQKYSSLGTINLVACAENLLLELVDQTGAVRFFETAEREFVLALLNFLSETIIGPCVPNQKALAKSGESFVNHRHHS